MSSGNELKEGNIQQPEENEAVEKLKAIHIAIPTKQDA